MADVETKAPRLVIASGDEMTKDDIIAMFRELSGRDPTDEEIVELEEELKKA